MTDRNEGGNPESTADADADADVPPVLPSEQPGGNNGGGVLSPDELDFTESPYVAEVSESRYVVSADHSPPNVPDETQRRPSSRDESASTQTQPAADATDTPGTADGRSTDTETRKERPSQQAPAREQVESEQDRAQQAQGQGQGQGRRQQQDQQPPQQQQQHPHQPTPQPPQSPEHARSILADELDRTDARLALDIVAQFGSDSVRHRTASDDIVGTFDNLVLWYAQHVARKTPTMRTASLLFAKSEFAPELTESQLRKTAAKHGLDETDTIGDLRDALE
ncbi:uncharacterized protein Nmag_2871 [Natrialba magadii ATCC 43099]|uniref:Flagella cluster protein n=1 Tax=Natrialba magadii (strain ATCC 43099 / DSM 3394 / CCM 3739 / CIP 104546 / IAM 13178 / JCM 8861 / NBRC 102185 / NCIMB 2190 / MS3) TaxID=547559 RepID=D3T0E5_NATMM|nr:hypothetical protein [Natrialba magadii]ADD06424.1 uncharacterized protein Nmag_2871 [Natrialba magadii ATCC 43099]ELY31689.1 flagella cluster protein [Natrialba magadii ATCC 43099]